MTSEGNILPENKSTYSGENDFDLFFESSFSEGKDKVFQEPESKAPINNQLSSSILCDIDNYIYGFKERIKSLYFSNEPEKIEEILKKTFPHMFPNKDDHKKPSKTVQYLDYFFSKLHFFKLLLNNKYEEGKEFHEQKLLPILKVVKPNEWGIKNILFEKLIDKQIDFFGTENYLENYYSNFTDKLDKLIQESFIETSKTKAIERERRDSSKELEQILNSINSTQNSSQTFYNTSSYTNGSITKGYSRDFEDRDEYGERNREEQRDEDRDEDRDENMDEQRHQERNRGGKQKASKKPKNTQKYNETSLCKILPMLNSFKPKYTKRENIDKKTIRKFRQFVVDQNKQKKFKIQEQVDSNFWILFVNGNLFPPIDFQDMRANERVAFKSLNSHYLLWFFSKSGVKEIYDNFINLQGPEFLQSLIKCYKITDESDKNHLQSYISNLPNIFDLSLLNENENQKELERSREYEEDYREFIDEYINDKKFVATYDNQNEIATSNNNYRENSNTYVKEE